MNKKAADTTVIENTIFIVLNIVFFAIMLIFVYNSGSNILVKEQSYAKEIALIIDNCKPGMSVLLNINDLIETAKKNNFPVENIVKLDKKNSVFGFQYFSKDAEVKLNNNWLLIEVGKSSLLEKETSERK